MSGIAPDTDLFGDGEGMFAWVRNAGLIALICCAAVRCSMAQQVANHESSAALQMQENNRVRMFADDRQKRMLQDADHLLAMAQQLKTAVDNARKDELSVQVIKQADEIERLAKAVKDRMRQ